MTRKNKYDFYTYWYAVIVSCTLLMSEKPGFIDHVPALYTYLWIYEADYSQDSYKIFP